MSNILKRQMCLFPSFGCNENVLPTEVVVNICALKVRKKIHFNKFNIYNMFREKYAFHLLRK